MSTIRRAYMEISNGIRGLRLHRDQSQPASNAGTTGPVKEILYKSNGNVTGCTAKSVRSPKHSVLTRIRNMNGHLMSVPQTIHQLFMDESFLSKFFRHFTAEEKGKLAGVCKIWKTILYLPKFWIDIMPIVNCREGNKRDEEMKLFYESLHQRGFDSICLFGATDDDVTTFVTYFPSCRKQIRSISLRCSNITDSSLDLLFKRMICIYRLELSGCNEITEAGLWSCLNPKIVSLSVTDCINVADDTVGAISQLLPSLYELNLQAYHVTDAALTFFSSKQSYTLCILRLNSCWEITNHGIVNIVHALPNLTVLSLSGCSKITDDGVELIAENLRKLKVLDLSWCPRITDASLEYIACDLSQLEELVLDR